MFSYPCTGASYTLLDQGKSVAYSEFVGQHLQLCTVAGGGEPTVLTAASGGFRYADGRADDARSRLVMVRETEAESPTQVVNQVVSVPYSLSGEAVSAEDIKLLATSRDFYSYPRLSSDGRKLAYVCWNHPNMPWDNTELLVQDLDADGQPEGEPRRVSAGGEESVCQPLWTPSGALVFLSDSTTGFYNLHVVDAGSTSARCLLARPGTEFCSSHQGWSLGLQSFHLLSDDTLICTFGQGGVSKVCTVRVSTGELTILELPDLPPAISEVAVRLQHTTSHCNMLQHAATCCNL